jgi:competence protein ComEC
MKLPAVAIVAAFSGGILVGHSISERIAGHLHASLFTAFAALMLFLALALFLVAREKLLAAFVFSLLAWSGAGALAFCVSNRPLPEIHVLRRINDGTISLSTPLRWHGRLRGDPARLPWGYGLDLQLDGVETANGVVPLSGGMRLGFTPENSDHALPDVQAGDEVSILTQARLPLVYRDAGTFDRRAFLAQQDIHLLATLRANSLLELVARSRPTLSTRIAHLRSRLQSQLDSLFAQNPQTAAILRAMLLGDRSFVDRSESLSYQQTGVFHVLVVAGLHVGALAFFCIWIARLLRLHRTVAVLFLLTILVAYIAVVEQRPPVLRAGLMAIIIALAGMLYRRQEVLNSAALAALLLLVAKPASLFDSSFQLSFLAIGCIAAIALPWIESHLQPYIRGLKAWRDPTLDGSFPPRIVQFRLDLRSAANAASGIPILASRRSQDVAALALRLTLRAAELVSVSLVLQFGMLPLLARDFHRVTLFGPFANVLVVPLTGAIVPLGFFTLGAGLLLPPRVARIPAAPLNWLIALQKYIVDWLAHLPHGSYRIPPPPSWLIAAFFLSALTLAFTLHFEHPATRHIRRAATLTALIAAVIIAAYPFAPTFAAGFVEMDVLDVAQGDSILLISPKGSTLLIDGGGAFQGFPGREEHVGSDPGEEAVSPYLWSRGIQKLDAVALTHAHQDHIGGLSAILENFHAGRITLQPTFEQRS